MSAVFTAVSALAIAGLHAVACIALGARFAQGLGVRLDAREGTSLALRMAVAGSLGAGLLTIVWLAVALAGALSAAAVALSLGLAIVAGGAPAARLLRRAGDAIVCALRGVEARTLAPLAALLALVIAAQGVASLGPPQGDALAFYMVLAKLVAASGRLVPLPGYEEFSQIHLFGELHFAALYALHGEAAAKASAWTAAVAASLALWGVGAEVGLGRAGRGIAVAIAWGSSAFALVVADGKVDVFAAALGLAAVGAALRCGGRDAARDALGWACISGFLTGCAVVAKISYAAALVPCVAIVAAASALADSDPVAPSGARVRRLAMAAGLCAAFGALAVAPQLVKNALLFDAPLAPFVGAQLGVSGMLSGSSWLNQAWLAPEAQRRLLALYPFALVYGLYPMQYGNLSALALAFAPLLALFPERRGVVPWRLVTVSLAALAGIAAFVVIRPSVLAPRYYLAPLLLLALAPASGAERALQRGPALLRGAVVAALALSLGSALLGVTGAWQAASASWTYLRGASPDDPLRAAAAALAADAPRGSRVLFATYERYWFRDDLLACASGSRDLLALHGLHGAPLWEEIQRRGFRYVALGQGFQYRDASGSLHALGGETLRPEDAPAWLAVDEVARNDTVRLYALHVRDRSAPAPEWACRPDGGGWKVEGGDQ